jgi:DNA-binding GntR family transcriptional regulator
MEKRNKKLQIKTKTQVRPQMLIDEAYHKIKQMIFQRKLKAHQRLIYNDLADFLKMSRTPIINALNRLEQEGFILSQPFRGFIVKPINVQEAWDLFGLREALESYAVEQAIHQTKPGDMRILQDKVPKTRRI